MLPRNVWFRRSTTIHACVASLLVMASVLHAAPAAFDESLEMALQRARSRILRPQLREWTGTLRYKGTPWDDIFASARENPEVRKWMFDIVTTAEAVLRESPSNYTRPRRFEDIPSDKVDSIALKAGRNREARALAMSDCTQTQWLLQRAIPLAIAARYTGRDDLTAAAIAILQQVSTWIPLQRPGWSLMDDSAVLPTQGDGPNMATAWGVSAVVDMLDVLQQRVPSELRDRLVANLRGEVDGIVRGWADELPWYVRSRAVMSNQWVDPSVALVKACLFIQDPALLPYYNFGVENVAQTLAASREDGAFLEGVTYAQMSGGSVCAIVRAIAANGDDRCDRYPFVQRFWFWLLQMQMPGAALVNCCDSKMASLPSWARQSPLSSMVDAALVTKDPAALSALRWAFPVGNSTVSGIEYAVRCARAKDSPRWNLQSHAMFPSQQLVVWRSEYERPSDPQRAWGLWIKGGTLEERSHGHRDQGQVSVYQGDAAVLLDCGDPPDYGDPDLEMRFATAAGHSIMQIGEIRPRVTAVDAPLQVRRLDDEGGSVQVDTSRAYSSTKSCIREVRWDRVSRRVEIVDLVHFLKPVDAGSEVYRFHTGSAAPVSLEGGPLRWEARWPGASMFIEADVPVRIDQVDWPDGTRAPFHHAALRIRAVGPLERLQLKSTLTLEPDTGAARTSP